MAEHESVDTCLGLHFIHHMKRKFQEDLHFSCWNHPYLLHTPHTHIYILVQTLKAKMMAMECSRNSIYYTWWIRSGKLQMLTYLKSLKNTMKSFQMKSVEGSIHGPSAVSSFMSYCVILLLSLPKIVPHLQSLHFALTDMHHHHCISLPIRCFHDPLFFQSLIYNQTLSQTSAFPQMAAITVPQCSVPTYQIMCIHITTM